MNVSVVIPAHNAAETIAETLHSLQAQTFDGWEAIVVDDGSTDETTTVVADFVRHDARIRMVTQSSAGVSIARNTGIGLARFDWLLFLDSDDWILPTHLEHMMQMLAGNPALDAVHCGWIRVLPDGNQLEEEYCLQEGDLFPLLAHRCAFIIHACIVRRSLVEDVGCFDRSYIVSEDWDLWQRIARTGARFGALREALACYRIRPGSATSNHLKILTYGLRVITQGRSLDQRVPHPSRTHVQGMPIRELSHAKFYLMCYVAGLRIGYDQDACILLDGFEDERAPHLDAWSVANTIFSAITHSKAQLPGTWTEFWSNMEQPLADFLVALEKQTLAEGLSRSAQTSLERLVAEHSNATRPLTIGTTPIIRVELTQPLHDVRLPAEVEHLHCLVELEGRRIGALELPICDGFLPRSVLADAIAAEFAWPILERFFTNTIYRELNVEAQPTGVAIQRGELVLVQELSSEEANFWPRAHDQIGWTVFLQEIWGCLDWPEERFYQTKTAEEPEAPRWIDDNQLVIDVSETLSSVKISGKELSVIFTVGGSMIGVVKVPAAQRVLSSAQLRTALSLATGFELCRVAVREAIIGRPLRDHPSSLRARLANLQKANASPKHDGATNRTALENASASKGQAVDGSIQEMFGTPDRVLPVNENWTVLGQRPSGKIGTSASRRAVLPVEAKTELIEIATRAGQPLLRLIGEGDGNERLVYLPDIVGLNAKPKADLLSCWQRLRSKALRAGQRSTAKRGAVRDPKQASSTRSHSLDSRPQGRHEFEALFAKEADPWQYTSPYEQVKYEQTLSLLPSGRIGRALELACAEGHFTVQFAPRVEHLLATDISQIALDRAAEGCASLKNIEFKHLDLTNDPLPGRFDLIVCSEVLYYAGGRDDLAAVARKIAAALEPGGYFLTAHAHLLVDEPDRTGYNWDVPFGAKVIGETFAQTSSLRLIKELRTPLYRIQLFRRDASNRPVDVQSTPEIIELPQPTPPPPRAAHTVMWDGGTPQHEPTFETVVTNQLPILMYHRVSPTGSPDMSRYRVTPEAFEEQLRYLRDAGFYSVQSKDWCAAAEVRKPLPGRAVLISFDDGYTDFSTYAWPLLKRYGFSASVFLVASQVGGSNAWDRVYGESLPLMGWQDIRYLQKKGVEFGSHSVSHRRLTSLSPLEVVREAALSRSILEQELKVAVDAFAYPYGDTNKSVQHLLGACGYVSGFSCRSGLSKLQDPLLELPRIEVTGNTKIQEFIAQLK